MPGPEQPFDDLLAPLLSRPDSGPAHATRVQRRAPSHVVYGGAHLFKATTPARLGSLAKQALDTFAPTPDALGMAFDGLLPTGLDLTALHTALTKKLETAAIEDLRIDFEDGFGPRSDADEDAEAVRTAKEVALALGHTTTALGIRVRPLDGTHARRAARTLGLHVDALVEASGGRIPDGYRVTLPKVQREEEVETLVALLGRLEQRHGIAPGTFRVELMVELPEAIVDGEGRLVPARWVAAAGGRCDSLHFGAYDYLSALGIPAREQRLDHAACDTARGLIQLSLANSGASFSDGATTQLPIPPVKAPVTDEDHARNRSAVHAAWRLHFRNVWHALSQGIPQGWDLHPSQVVPRHAAVIAFHRHAFDAAAQRLARFLDTAARATEVGGAFDDAATAQGLLNATLDAVDTGAVNAEELVRLTGRSLERLRTRDFATLVVGG